MNLMILQREIIDLNQPKLTKTHPKIAYNHGFLVAKCQIVQQSSQNDNQNRSCYEDCTLEMHGIELHDIHNSLSSRTYQKAISQF